MNDHQRYNSMAMPTEDEMRSAIDSRDKSRDRDFIYAVITTGVFCRPSCSSRAAKPENLRFFANSDAAMAAGFRPCKRCKPIDAERPVSKLVDIALHIEQHADQKLPLSALAKLSVLSPTQLQRQFTNTFGISPKAYQDAVRFRQFKHTLQQGRGVTEALLSSGYGSTSRVYGEPSRNIGMSHKSYRDKGAGEEISFAVGHTEIGLIMLAATDKGVCFAEFGDNETTLYARLETEFSNASLALSASQDGTQLSLWMDALVLHVNNGAPKPDLPIDMRGTAFQMKVWQFLLSIKEGEVMSYTDVASHIKKPKACRAVATACAKNRIALLIPCHRVLRGDGKLGGYRWGLERKKALLNIEKS